MAGSLVLPRAETIARRLAALVLAVALLAHNASGLAQDRAVPPQLEDLIPDRAVENPDEWAGEGANDTAQESTPLEEAEPPFDELQIPGSGSPELEFSDAEPEQIAEQDSQTGQFDDLGELGSRRAREFAAVNIDRNLELAFRAGEGVFPERDEFIRRFRQLREAGQMSNGTDNVALQAARIRADRDLLERQLRAYGYYDARVFRRFDGQDDVTDQGAQAAVRLAVIPGRQYRFGVIDLGELAQAPDHARLREEFAIVSGDALLADRIVERRDALAIELGETGYPFARFEPPELLIDHERSEGDLTLEVSPGGKYEFGEVTSSQPGFLSGKHLGRIARFDPGDLYQRSLEDDLRQAIQATGLVSSVTITPREVKPPDGEQPGELAIDVALEKGRLRTIAGAIGYGTEDGVKVEASWEHRNLFPPEGALRIRGIFGTRERLAGIGFRRNNFRARDQLLSIDTYASDITTEAVEAKTVGLRGTFERYSNLLFQKELSWQVGAELAFSDERNRRLRTIALPRQEYLVGSVFGRVTIDRSDSLLDPKTGFRASAFLAPEFSHGIGREAIYLRGQLDGSYYLPVQQSVTMAARARFATIQGAQTFEVAPSRRIYAGGGSSVRGYAYQAVGPRTDFGQPTGGRSLVELSVEARIDTGFFDKALQIVPFFDLGTVSLETTPDFRFVSYGAGIGVRYKTGFGPIRVDLGIPLNRNPMFDSPFAVYVSLGQAF